VNSAISRLGILGGTFDPIHIGHLRAAIELLEILELKRVHLLAAAIPAHRAAPLFSATRRLEFARMTCRAEPRLYVDARELERTTPSYMIDSLRELRAEFPHTMLLMALGVDAYNGLESWQQAGELLNFCHVVVLSRPGCVLRELELTQGRFVAADGIDRAVGQVCQIQIPQLQISASMIRERIEDGRSLHGLLNAEVCAAIEQDFPRHSKL